MKAIALYQGEHALRLVDIADISLDNLGPCEIAVETWLLGVCGTDLHLIDSLELSTPDGKNSIVLGHEALGLVIAVGKNVPEEGKLLGKYVVPHVRLKRPDVTTRYRIDMESSDKFVERGINFRDGFGAKTWISDYRDVAIVPSALPVELGILAEPFSVSEKAVTEAMNIQKIRLGVEAFWNPNPRVLVAGMRAIGFSAAMIALAHGFDVTMLGLLPHDSKPAQLAKSMGIHYCNSSEVDFKDWATSGAKFDMIFEAAGDPALPINCIQVLSESGILVLIGIPQEHSEHHVDLGSLWIQMVTQNQIYLGTVNCCASRDFRNAFMHMTWLEKAHPGVLNKLITNRYDLDEFHKAYKIPQGPEIKSVIKF